MSTVPLQNNEAPLVPANEASLVNKDLVTFTLAPTTTAVKKTFLDIGTQDRASERGTTAYELFWLNWQSAYAVKEVVAKKKSELSRIHPLAPDEGCVSKRSSRSMPRDCDIGRGGGRGFGDVRDCDCGLHHHHSADLSERRIHLHH